MLVSLPRMCTKNPTNKAGRAICKIERGIIITLFVLLSACSTNPPVQEMSDARQAISNARETGAEDHAAEELHAAEAFLDSAKRNLSGFAYASARRDAMLARENARKALDKIAKLDVLDDEIVTDPRQSSQTDSGMIERPSRLQTELPPLRPAQVLSSSSALPPQASFDTIGGGDYLVQQGDTLWSITQRVRLDNRLTMHQTMLAIFEANPEVFTGNINMMMVGANLRIPSAAEISRANRRDALSEVQRENAAWSSITSDVGTQPDLVLVPPDDDQTSYDGSVRETEPGVGAVTTAERIRQIEQQIADQELLVEIRGDNLSALRDESARFRNEEIAEPVVLDNVDATLADDDATIDTTLKPMANDDDGIIAADTSEDIRIDDAGAVKDTELDIMTMALPRVVTLPAELGIGERMIKLLSGFWRILIGGLLIVLGILFWFSRRAARGDDEDLTGMWNALDSNEDDESPIERLVPEDVSGDLHDAHTMMEVGTKLDLARAYVDMGDHVARSILEEVLDEGDESQKKQAQQLLDLLPR